MTGEKGVQSPSQGLITFSWEEEPTDATVDGSRFGG